MAASREREVDRLFRVPLEDFVAARNDLAARLRRDGDAEGAEAVRKLAKPTVAVWAINQLAERDGAGVRELLAAGAALRKAQERTLRGSGGGDALRDAQGKERAAVQQLTQRAREILAEAKRPASAATLERVSRTLGAAAVDDGAREALKAGRLTEELEPPGFGLLAGFDLPPAGERAHVRDELAERRAQKAERERRRRELQARVRELEAAARDAEREAARAAAAAEDARKRADAARAAAEEAAAELAEL